MGTNYKMTESLHLTLINECIIGWIVSPLTPTLSPAEERGGEGA
jgi:hypothetical protein